MCSYSSGQEHARDDIIAIPLCHHSDDDVTVHFGSWSVIKVQYACAFNVPSDSVNYSGLQSGSEN